LRDQIVFGNSSESEPLRYEVRATRGQMRKQLGIDRLRLEK
jgi:hypothetical protein